jgi:hypothetical protein
VAITNAAADTQVRSLALELGPIRVNAKNTPTPSIAVSRVRNNAPHRAAVGAIPAGSLTPFGCLRERFAFPVKLRTNS